MTHGVTINGTDTKTTFGLILCADLAVESPKLREERVTIPGRNGSLNMSYALTGAPVYDDRGISFKLFKADTEANMETLRVSLYKLYHGREVTLKLPGDGDYSYHGVMQVGGRSGYNGCLIDLNMTAEPWRLKDSQTEVTKNLDTTSLTISLTNAMMPTLATVTVSTETKLEVGTQTYTLSAGTWSNKLNLASGTNTVNAYVTAGTGTIVFKYTEGVL